MHPWLEAASERVAREAGVEPALLALTQEEIEELLELARIAAHESGERINAPLVSYLVGLARGRGEATLTDVVDAAVGKTI